MRPLAFACGAAAALALAACSSSSPPAANAAPAAAPQPAIRLLDRLDPAADAPGAVVVDVAKVRSLLKLPADTSPFSSSDPTHHHYMDLLAPAVPELALATPVPALDAIDFGQVTAAANNGNAGRERVVALATTQPFAQLASALSAKGYTGSGDLLQKQVANWTTDIAAIAGAPGVIALGTDPAAVQAAVEGKAHGISGPVRDALANLNAPAAQALAPAGSCVSVIAISDDISSDDGGRLLIVTDAPQPARLAAASPADLGQPTPHLGSPTVTGRQLTVPYSFSNSIGIVPISPLGYYLQEIPLDQIYRCS
jgi:hypothetical protein